MKYCSIIIFPTAIALVIAAAFLFLFPKLYRAVAFVIYCTLTLTPTFIMSEIVFVPMPMGNLFFMAAEGGGGVEDVFEIFLDNWQWNIFAVLSTSAIAYIIYHSVFPKKV